VKNDLIRKTWPKIRIVKIKGQKFYRVDARRAGTHGKQESFKSQKEAEARAAEIEEQFNGNGTEGLAFPAELRGMALTAEKMLTPYGKTLLQAAEFYKAHMDAEKKRIGSATVSELAHQWYQDKKSGKAKKLRAATLKGIHEAHETLKTVFAGKHILDLTTDSIQTYLDGLSAGLRRKFNINSRFSQFFNWCIRHGHLTVNLCDKIDIHVDGKDITIFSPTEALNLMTVCKEKHPDLVLYHAISLFAGLRPRECQLLKWEHVHLEEKTITVLAATSKTKESRNVPIEPNLLVWLEQTNEAGRKGFVTKQVNLVKRLKALHVALGYRSAGKNEEAQEWPQDVMRHSYVSYWLAKFKNRATLAENMGNSIQIIKRHYKRVVGKSECAQYWSITPTYDGTGEIQTVIPQAEVKKARGKRLAAVLSKS
jgi:integrase